MTTKESRFQSHDWRDFYGDGVEELPSDMPKPLWGIDQDHDLRRLRPRQ